ncbi:MAG: hypothetical protein H7248_07300 [Microbacteriaceae bacterium]|nr:hypothetical protein [Microbacteriaceae bacterium]
MPLVIGLLALGISLYRIGTPALWYDETATVVAATRTWPELWNTVIHIDAVHALYYALMHVWFDLVGYTPTTLRLPSALAVGFAAALTVVFTRQLSALSAGRAAAGTARPGQLLGAVSGLVFCLLPRVTWLGTEGRSYALTTALAALLTVVLLAAVRSGRRRWWVLYVATALLACVAFLYLALLVVAHALGVLLWFLADSRRAVARTLVPALPRRTVLATLTVGLLLLPFALLVMGEQGQIAWLLPLDGGTIGSVLRTQWFYNSVEFAVAGWALIIWGSVRLVNTNRGSAAILLPGLLFPTLALLLATATVTPLYTPRYLVMSLPFVAAVMATGILALANRRVTILLLAALVALAIPPILTQRMPAAKENTAWQRVAALIATQRAADPADSRTAIIYGSIRYHPSASARVIAYSYPAAFTDTLDLTLRTPANETGRLWETSYPLKKSLHRLGTETVAYLVTSVTENQRPRTTRELATVGWRQTASWHIANVNIVRYVNTR